MFSVDCDMFDCDKFDWFLLICLFTEEEGIRQFKDVVERNLVNRGERDVERDAE